MTTADAVREVGLALPRTHEQLVGGRWKLKVRQIVYVAFSKDERDMGFGFPREQRDSLVESATDVFFLPRASDLRYQWVCVHLDRLGDEEMRELVRRGLSEAVFSEVNRQLQAQGLVVKTGTLIDATLIAAAAAEPAKQKGGGRSKADPDAAWAKQGAKARFGYKLHVAVDQGSGLVRAARLTPANVNEITVGPDLVQGDEAAVWADKAYVGPTMRAAIRAAGGHG